MLAKFRSQDSADLRASVWAGFLLAASLAVGLSLARAGYPLPPIWALLLLGAVAAIAELQSVALTDRIEMSVSVLPVVFAAVAFGPLAAFFVGAMANAADLKRPFLRAVVYTPVRALTGASAGLAAWHVANVASGFSGYLIVSTAAICTNMLVDGLFAALTLAVRRTGNAIALALTTAPVSLFQMPLYVPLVASFVYGYHVYSLWVVVAFFAPALALQRLINLYQNEREATRHLAAANSRLESANLSFATALVATLDARDHYTAGHSAAVAIYARDIAQRMGLAESEQRLVHLAGLVHDVGKIGLSAGLLEKPGALSLEEHRQMQQHSVIGERILRNVDDYAEIASIVRHHHERVDGLGYPDGISQDEIPLLSRVIAVADAYNAMTSDRPYRDAMPSRVARLRLAQAVESQFDTSVVAAFEAVLATATEAYRMGRSDEFLLDSGIVREESEPIESATVGGLALGQAVRVG